MVKTKLLDYLIGGFQREVERDQFLSFLNLLLQHKHFFFHFELVFDSKILKVHFKK